MAHITIPPYINPKSFDPHYVYGSNELGARDPLAIALPDRTTYEQACAIFGVAPKSDEQLWHAAPLLDGPDFPREEWAALGRNGRVSFRLDSIYYFTLKRSARTRSGTGSTRSCATWLPHGRRGVYNIRRGPAGPKMRTGSRVCSRTGSARAALSPLGAALYSWCHRGLPRAHGQHADGTCWPASDPCRQCTAPILAMRGPSGSKSGGQWSQAALM